MEKKDRGDRKNNIIIKGIIYKEYGQKLREELENVIEEKIKVKAEVKYARKIGRDNMIIAKIGSFEQKINIMKNKSKLGNTGLKTTERLKRKKYKEKQQQQQEKKKRKMKKQK